jgi:hypothetical protein
MTSAADAQTSSRAALVVRVAERLAQVVALTATVRQALRLGDAERIVEATARLETLALEISVLAAEHDRLPAEPSTRELAQARAALERAIADAARGAALGSGLLERMVWTTRRLIETLERGSTGAAYLPTGRGDASAHAGRLRGQA